MSAPDWIATVAGVVLVAAGLREIFSTLLHPKGVGQLTPVVFRTVWRGGRRVGRPLFGLAGPLAIVASIVLWALLLVLGWALVLWPHLPGAFQVTDGVPVSEQGGFLDAVYVSGVSLATLGFGDIVAEAPALRLALVLEAMVGFVLLTASISWVLSVYPALLRRRALAARIAGLVPGGGPVLPAEPAAVRATVLYELAAQLGTAQVDLLQYPSAGTAVSARAARDGDPVAAHQDPWAAWPARSSFVVRGKGRTTDPSDPHPNEDLPMTHTAEMVRTHPHPVPTDTAAVVACVEACRECATVCTACADACLAEDAVGDLRHCIRLDLDCADLCAAAGRIAARQTAGDVEVLRAALEACATACARCATECEGHAEHHEHCRVCAAACRECETACRELLVALQ